MKCPHCGHVMSERRKRCGQCGSLLSAVRTEPSAASLREVSGSQTEPEEQKITEPEWRKEISQKVRAYGEKKKYLTTPPGPLKDQAGQDSESRGGPDTRESSHAGSSAQSARQRPASAAQKSNGSGRSATKSSTFATPHTQGSVPAGQSRADLKSADLPREFPPELEPTEEPAPGQLYLIRRAGALLIDSVLFSVVSFAGFWFYSWLLNRNWQEVLSQKSLATAGVFLLAHCLYYLYFYKTSRQTPGQVFFGLELKDPTSRSISTGKIILRWGAMVLLNIFNFLPLAFGKRYLILDRISETEIRSFA
jgi:uncharacterized RDD family membrane protein YckC